jgi:hypothetical protein
VLIVFDVYVGHEEGKIKYDLWTLYMILQIKYEILKK